MIKKDNIKKDTSPLIHQRDKIKNYLTIKELNWSEKQKEFIKLALDKKTKVIFITGPAGSSKSILAVYSALKLLNEKRISDIIYIRSAVESSEKGLGYLPGSLDEKMHFYNLPFLEKLDELLPKNEIQILQKDERVKMFPVNYARGLNWNAKCVIMDEAQNSSHKEIVTILTRLGEFSKCFILADPMQTDLFKNQAGSFERLSIFLDDDESKEQGIFAFAFSDEDVKRSALVKYLTKKLKKL